MSQGLKPSYYCGATSDLHSGTTTISAWGLDATQQLAAGQIVTAPVATITDQSAGGTDVTSTMLVGSPTIGPNAAGTANTVVTVALTAAEDGHTYWLTIDYVPSPPSPSGENLPLLLVLSCLY